MSLEIIREVSQQTRLKAQKNSRLIFSIGGSISVLLTLAFYSLGIVQEDSLYSNMPLAVSIPIVLLTVFNAIMFTSLIILFLKSFGEYSVPKVVDGYWNIASKFILRERFKKNTAEGIWDYVKLHRKHDPLYKADFDLLNEKCESNTTQISELKETDKSQTTVIARNHRDIFDLQHRVKAIEEEKKQNQNTIPLEEYERVCKELLKTKEELNKLKGE